MDKKTEYKDKELEFAEEIKTLFESIADNEGDLELVEKDLEQFRRNKIINNNDNISIYLDDLREAPKDFIRTHSVNETIEIIEELEKSNKTIKLIDLDHDLGDYANDGGDAIKLLDWLVERNTLYPINVHTMNGVGRDNMQRMIDRYWRNK